MAGFEHIEAAEKEKQQHRQHPQLGCAQRHPQQRQLHQHHATNTDQKQGPQLAPPLHGKQRHAHEHKRQQHRGQINPAVVGLHHTGLHQQSGHRHPGGKLHRIQHKHAHVQAQQIGGEQLGPSHPGHATLGHGRLGRGPPHHHGHAGHGHHCRQIEQTGQAGPLRQPRPHHQRQGKHQANAAAQERQGLGAHHVTGLVGQQGADGRRNRAAALHGAAPGQGVQVARAGRDQAAHGEQSQAKQHDALAAPAVGGQAKGNLQQRLHQAVHAQRQPHGGGIFAAGVAACLEGKHGQHHEQAQHPHGVDRGQGKTGAPLQCCHAGCGVSLGGGVGHGAGMGRKGAYCVPSPCPNGLDYDRGLSFCEHPL